MDSEIIIIIGKIAEIPTYSYEYSPSTRVFGEGGGSLWTAGLCFVGSCETAAAASLLFIIIIIFTVAEYCEGS